MNGRKATTTTECAIDHLSSRACNRGTRGCTLRHWSTTCAGVALSTASTPETANMAHVGALVLELPERHR